MSADDATFRQISDTARWVAVYRALESERPDAAFRDPFARRLAGERGEQIAASMTFASRNSWPFVARTWLIDQFVAEQVRRGVDMVVNLAAGLDARPYRMELPPSLSWIEVDLPEILAHKEEVLRDEKPNCAVARVRLDLSNVAALRELFSTLGGRARRAAIVAEGLLVYLADDDVASLARDLSACPTFGHWIIDLSSPSLLRMLARKKMSAPLDQAGFPLRFAPSDGPEFFTHCGWRAQETRSIIHAAAGLNRLPFFLRLIAKISSAQFNPKRPWSGVCLLGRP